MKIKTKTLSYDRVMALPRPQRKKPLRPNFLLQSLVRLLAIPDLRKTRFSYRTHRMEAAGDGPWLILMNHSAFIDLEIASRIFYPKRYCIVCTEDGFIGKSLLMRLLGCIPTQKFTTDTGLVADIRYALETLRTSVLMYPEASYSFDGCATPLPRHMGLLLKRLRVPVVYVQTYGAFSHQPLYNSLRKRNVNIRADVTCLLTPEEIREKSVDELDAILDTAFSFDHFAWQAENGVKIDVGFRAEGLNRILFRCPHCNTEGQTEGKGTTLTCHACGKVYEMDEYGKMCAADGETEFSHIPRWYQWQRETIRKALEDGTYRLDTEVEIGMVVDHKAVYMVGEGRLIHDENGFTLTGCDGKLRYTREPKASYSLYADYFWYELGDVICIGDRDQTYCCFPKGSDVVARTRIAVEELFKMYREQTQSRRKVGKNGTSQTTSDHV